MMGRCAHGIYGGGCGTCDVLVAIKDLKVSIQVVSPEPTTLAEGETGAELRAPIVNAERCGPSPASKDLCPTHGADPVRGCSDCEYDLERARDILNRDSKASEEYCINCETTKVPGEYWTKCPNQECVAYNESKATGGFRSAPTQRAEQRTDWCEFMPAGHVCVQCANAAKFAARFEADSEKVKRLQEERAYWKALAHAPTASYTPESINNELSAKAYRESPADTRLPGLHLASEIVVYNRDRHGTAAHPAWTAACGEILISLGATIGRLERGEDPNPSSPVAAVSRPASGFTDQLRLLKSENDCLQEIVYRAHEMRVAMNCFSVGVSLLSEDYFKERDEKYQAALLRLVKVRKQASDVSKKDGQ